MAREQTHRVARIHSKGLLIGHRGKILHRQSVLRPVLEDGSIAAVDNQFVRVLRHARVEVVLNHRHNGRCLTRTGRIFVDGTSIHLVGRTVAVHIDAPILPEFVGKLACQLLVQVLGKVAQSVLECQHFLFLGEDIFAFGSVVDGGVVGFHLGQRGTYTCQDFFLECHDMVMFIC